MLKHIQLRYPPEKLLLIFLPLLFFVTPLSSSAKSILIGVVVAIIIASPRYRQDLATLFSNHWCRSALFLFFLALVGCLWSPASLGEKGLVLEKWSKLLYLPILIVGFQDTKIRNRALHAFLFAMLLTCVLSFFIQYTHYFHIKNSAADSVFRNHIMTGMMMSFATYVALLFSIQARGTKRIGYLVLSLIFSYQILFVNQGRTGYVLFLLLMAALIIQQFNKRQAAIGLLALITLFSSCYYLSSPLQHGIHRVIYNLQSYEQNKNTPIGYRLQFHAFAKNLFKSHPLIGGGTGSFTYSFRTENPVPAWTNNTSHSGRLLEPHSQYWLVAAEFGVVGLLGLLWFYLELLVIAYRLDAMRPIAMALLLIFALGNTSDSLLFYSGSGYFFILFFALALSEKANSIITATRVSMGKLNELKAKNIQEKTTLVGG
ncbi:MAG: O-antigen ligase family protein [Legionellaceae bacterium]|nr:O-antigen ligase family protein [Legionellaceae bacterium]